ncbi:HTTM domain-containing protein [Celeribacter marinus]|uniref:HTTM domain-containing protein n=1 Tax=Celeribacter marinus TaxID=1397108 RepID=UPI003F6B7DED
MSVVLSLSDTVRLTEVLLSVAVIQQSAEHMTRVGAERLIFGVRVLVAFGLLIGDNSGPLVAGVAIAGLFAAELVMLHRFQGPYNGGSSKMTLLIIACLGAYHLAPTERGRELAVAYLAAQLTLSYFVSGYVKVIRHEWRSGRALTDVFRFSAYPVSERLRGWADRPRVLLAMSWGVMGFELVFPLTLLHPLALMAGLFVAAGFHFSNALFFGLNRFFWIWICAYPSILWFQGRVFG